MDPASSPWRILEESGEASGQTAGARPGGLASRDRIVPIAAIALAVVLALAAFAVAANGGRPTVEVAGAEGGDAGAAEASSTGAGTSGDPVRLLVVDVQGAVVHPGVVQLVTGSRVGDAIAAAGGYGPRVAPDRVARTLNLAAILEDGDQVVVPSRDDPTTPRAQSSGAEAAAGGGPGAAGDPTVVDLNTATEAELDALPGIGPVTAAKIIAAREEQPYRSVEELQTRKILGAATFDRVKTLVVVR
ncbi:MAG TPA: ComEA family DNA-binding protein [Candidatus Limnocylindrales bacterium]